MKLSTRLGIIVACAALGTMVLGTLNLQSLRATMMEERRAQIKMVLMLTQKQVETYANSNSKCNCQLVNQFNDLPPNT